jgi:membrane-anchored protein YejM (alkaline phosphatase superfamily)
LSFISSHLVYLGGCQFLSPDHHAAGEPAALLSDDGPSFLEKHGLLDAQDYQRRLVEQGAPEAVSVQYPLSDLRYRDWARATTCC